MVRFLYQRGGSILMVAAFLIGILDSFSAFRELVDWVSPFGMQPIHLAFWLLGIGASYTIIVQEIRIRRLENTRPEIEVCPNSPVGRELCLVVHNKSQIPTNFSAVMTCTFDYGELMNDVRIQGLMNVSMCWEASGKASEIINGDGRKILKLCSIGETFYDGLNLIRRWMQFYKVESDSLRTIECAHCSKDSRIPKVKVNIQIDSSIPLKGQRTWVYQVEYVKGNGMLGISRR